MILPEEEIAVLPLLNALDLVDNVGLWKEFVGKMDLAC